MGAQADVHCYTPAEFERKREALPVVRWAAERGLRPARLPESRHKTGNRPSVHARQAGGTGLDRKPILATIGVTSLRSCPA